MKDSEFLKKLAQLGLPLFAVEDEIDANQTLAEVITSGDPRLIEGFPVMFANAQKKFGFDRSKVESFLSENDKSLLKKVILLSLGVYEAKGLRFSWAKQLLNDLTDSERKLVSEYKEYLLAEKEFPFYEKKLRAQNILSLLDEYYKEEALKTKKKVAKYQELSIENALSQIFSPKQKELFLKKVAGEKLTKTESEYYSRRVKKKVSALANTEIHNLAKMLMR